MKEVGTRPIKKVPTLRGRTVINLFFEPSTRTRMSFELAEKRLSADTLGMTTAGSSVVEGRDARRHRAHARGDGAGHDRHAPRVVGRAASARADLPGQHHQRRRRHARASDAGAARRVHDAASARAGSRGLRVAIVGDLAHSRVLRSNVLLLTKMGADVARVRAGDAACRSASSGSACACTTSIDEAVEGADVVMMLRVQHERMHGLFLPSVREYFTLFGLTPARLERAAPDVIVMHPGPMNRGVEIDSEVADGPWSVILDQVANGVAVRMAVLYLLAGGEGETRVTHDVCC